MFKLIIQLTELLDKDASSLAVLRSKNNVTKGFYAEMPWEGVNRYFSNQTVLLNMEVSKSPNL
ncbi:MAG: hypothetical protein NUK65_01305 [Firmicutes bacterium]|nr:hypothetical protein [Bacillota bacterium]